MSGVSEKGKRSGRGVEEDRGNEAGRFITQQNISNLLKASKSVKATGEQI